MSTGPTSRLPRIAVTLGDPGGIGPEVIVKALNDRKVFRRASIRVLGLGSVLDDAAERVGVTPYWQRVPFEGAEIHVADEPGVTLLDYEPAFAEPRSWPRKPNKPAGLLSSRFVDDAIAMSRLDPDDPRRVDGIVTGPINKEAWDLAGRGRFPGHTDLLQYRFNAPRVGMLFDSPSLRVILATIHVPLMDVRNILTIGRVFDAIDLGNDACKQLGIAHPKIAVCGLNPHAGEGGLLGDEDQRLIAPAIEVAVDNGIDACGPFPADTVFNAAVAGQYDLVVAMYHDQGLIPIKLLHHDCAVNMTVGLPTIRTSPDHGTAFDIAGTGVAHSGSMRAAVELALRLAELQMVS
jgi:4-hydroxythreonine-4-phosphate dehydrogenase